MKFATLFLVFCVFAITESNAVEAPAPAALIKSEPAPSKKLRVAFGDNMWVPKQMLRAEDLVCTTADLGLGTNTPRMKLSKFFDTSRMTPPALSTKKQSGFNYICYDNENVKDWPTPKSELADPTRYTILAAKLAHEAGFKFLAEPNFEVLVGHGTRGVNGKLFLTERVVPSVRIPAVAPHLDAISLQLQRAQADVEQYQRLTRQLVKEIRAVNPSVIIFVQVTSREKSGKASSPADLMSAIQSVADVVDGIWIHTDKNQEAYAGELLKFMEQAGLR